MNFSLRSVEEFRAKLNSLPNKEQFFIPSEAFDGDKIATFSRETQQFLMNVISFFTTSNHDEFIKLNKMTIETLHNTTKTLTNEKMVRVCNELLEMGASKCMMATMVGNMAIIGLRKYVLETLCRLNDREFIERTMFGFLYIKCSEMNVNGGKAYGVSLQGLQYVIANFASPNNLHWISKYCEKALIYQMEQNAFVYTSLPEIMNIKHINASLDKKIFLKKFRAIIKCVINDIKNIFLNCVNFSVLCDSIRYITQFMAFSEIEFKYFLYKLWEYYSNIVNPIVSKIQNRCSTYNFNTKEMTTFRGAIINGINCLKHGLKTVFINHKGFQIVGNAIENIMNIIKCEYEIFINCNYECDQIIIEGLKMINMLFKKKFVNTNRFNNAFKLNCDLQNNLILVLEPLFFILQTNISSQDITQSLITIFMTILNNESLSNYSLIQNKLNQNVINAIQKHKIFNKIQNTSSATTRSILMRINNLLDQNIFQHKPQQQMEVENKEECKSVGFPSIERIKHDLESNNIMLQVERQLGKGTFGRVYAGQDRLFNKCAIKVVITSHEDTKILQKQRQNECQIFDFLKQAPNDYIIQCIGRFQNEYILYYIFERGYESLRQNIGNTQMNYKQKKRIIFEVSLALQYLHQNSIVHRDLKPENLIKTISNKYKLIDFGLAAFMTDDMNEKCGTGQYKAPEIYLSNNSYTSKIDIWSLGVVSFEILTGKRPFENINQICYQNVNFGYSKDGAGHLLTLMLNKNPTNRININEVISHSWFDDIRD